MIESLSSVSKVIKQDSASYLKNLNSLKSDYVLHGNDWVNTFQKKYRDEVLNYFKIIKESLMETLF